MTHNVLKGFTEEPVLGQTSVVLLPIAKLARLRGHIQELTCPVAPSPLKPPPLPPEQTLNSFFHTGWALQ